MKRGRKFSPITLAVEKLEVGGGVTFPVGTSRFTIYTAARRLGWKVATLPTTTGGWRVERIT